MNSYRSSVPRMAIGFVALTMSAVSFGALVMLPAQLENASPPNTILAASRHAVEPCDTADPGSEPREQRPSTRWARPRCTAENGRRPRRDEPDHAAPQRAS